MPQSSRPFVLLLPTIVAAAAILALVEAPRAEGAPRTDSVRDTKARPVGALALPGPAPRARPKGQDAAAANDACGACHREIAAEWRGSMHKAAYVDPVF